MSPSPPISFEVSTMTTRLRSSSASRRAHSRSIVVLPMPGRPSSRMLWPLTTMSQMISPVLVAELSDVVGDVLEVRCGHGAVGEKHLSARHARLGLAAEVENDLEQLARVGALVQRPSQV